MIPTLDFSHQRLLVNIIIYRVHFISINNSRGKVTLFSNTGKMCFRFFYHVLYQYRTYIFILHYCRLQFSISYSYHRIWLKCKYDLKIDCNLKIICYKTVEYDNRFVMVRSHMYIQDQNILECAGLILYVHQIMW